MCQGLIDFDRASPESLFRAVLGRSPETKVHVKSLPDYLVQLVACGEFQNRVTQLLVRAFSDKKRIIFLHIPKCAGSSLLAALSARYASLSFTIEDMRWVGYDELVNTVAKCVLMSDYCGTIVLGGHRTLPALEKRDIYRGPIYDKLFTIIRDPIELVISSSNYIADRLIKDTEERLPDTLYWLQNAAEPEILRFYAKRHNISELRSALLREERIIEPNVLSNFLGGRGQTAAISLTNIARTGIKVTNMSKLQDFAREQLGLVSLPHINQSDISKSPTISFKEIERIREYNKEDIELYDKISLLLKQTTDTSITLG